MTSNGVLHDPHELPALDALEPALRGLPFDLGRWRRLTELALAEGEKRRERVQAGISEAVAEAEAALARLDADLDVLRRALALTPVESVPVPQEERSPAANPPPPPLPPSVPLPVAPWVQALVDRENGKDLPPPPEIRQGQRTGMGVGYRASLYLLEVAQANTTGELTRRQAELACKGWGPGTIRDGLKRLADDGLVERPQRGLYRLTEAGRNAPPAPPGMLPLKEPQEPQEAGVAGFLALAGSAPEGAPAHG